MPFLSTFHQQILSWFLFLPFYPIPHFHTIRLWVSKMLQVAHEHMLLQHLLILCSLLSVPAIHSHLMNCKYTRSEFVSSLSPFLSWHQYIDKFAMSFILIAPIRIFEQAECCRHTIRCSTDRSYVVASQILLHQTPVLYFTPFVPIENPEHNCTAD